MPVIEFDEVAEELSLYFANLSGPEGLACPCSCDRTLTWGELQGFVARRNARLELIHRKAAGARP